MLSLKECHSVRIEFVFKVFKYLNSFVWVLNSWNVIQDKFYIGTTHGITLLWNRHTGITGFWTQELKAGLWTLDAALWALDSEHWTMDFRRWMLDCGRADCSRLNLGVRGEHLTSQLSWVTTWLLVIRVYPVHLVDELLLVFYTSIWLD